MSSKPVPKDHEEHVATCKYCRRKVGNSGRFARAKVRMNRRYRRKTRQELHILLSEGDPEEYGD